MKQNRNPDDIFYLLEHADDETIRHLSENYLSADADEMERIFERSEQKYAMRCQQESDPESAFAPVPEKPVRNSGIYRSIFAMTACLFLTAGAVTGIMKLKPSAPEEQPPSANTPDTTEFSAETETESVQTTEIRQAEISAETTYVTDMTEAFTTTVMTETTAESTAVTSYTQTTGITETSAPENIQTVTQTVIQAVPAETTVPEISETIPTETVPETTETETIPETTQTEEVTETVPETTEPETEPETETAQDPTSVFYLYSKDYSAEFGFEYIVNSVKVYPDEDAPDSFDVYYMPAWLPEGETFEGIHKTEKGDSISFTYQKGKAENINITQCLQDTFGGLAPDNGYMSEFEYSDLIYTTVNQYPACYFSWRSGSTLSYIIYWKQGGYIMMLETYTLSLEEAFQIAESCVPTAPPEEN